MPPEVQRNPIDEIYGYTCKKKHKHLPASQHKSPIDVICVFPTYNSMFVRLGTNNEIRNRGYFETIKNSADQFISKLSKIAPISFGVVAFKWLELWSRRFCGVRLEMRYSMG